MRGKTGPSVEGARIEAPKAPRGVGAGRGYKFFFRFLVSKRRIFVNI